MLEEQSGMHGVRKGAYRCQVLEGEETSHGSILSTLWDRRHTYEVSHAMLHNDGAVVQLYRL